MEKKLSHIGIAVSDLDRATRLFSRLLNVSPHASEEVEDQKVKISFFRVGETTLELTQATSPDSPIARFIQKRGEGVHHLSFVVSDLEAELARLRSEGFRLVDERPREGAGGYRIAFLHPSTTNGVLIELSEKRE